MCGIIAYIASDGGGPDERLLAAMNERHRLRGPDNRSRVVLAGGRIGMAHARLSIIDLSDAANQPMSSPDGRRWLSFNGEIYNYPELRDKLEGLGESFRTSSDTEVLLAALNRWGEQALEYVEGMFAFAYADLERGCLLAARDRLGIKPLYVFRDGNMTCFSSTLTPLTLLPGFNGEIDPASRFEMLVSKYVSGPASIYRQIRKVMPGTFWKVNFDGSASQKAYWSLEDCLEPSRPETSEDDRLEALEAAVRGAVSRQLVADVPVGVYLSGGIDSSLVAAVAGDLAGSVKTFCVGFDVPGYDESREARAVAEYLGTEHHEIRVGPAEVIKALKTLPGLYDEPFGDASAVPTYLLSAFASSEVKVVLSGDGGDEQFFGYSRYHRLMRARHLMRFTPGPVRALARRLTRSGPRSFAAHALSKFLAHPGGAGLYTHYCHENYALLAETAGAGSREMLYGTGLHQSALRAYEMSGRDLFRSMMLADLLNYLVDDCLVKVDRATMASSIEARVPLLDESIVRLSTPMPLSMKWRDGRGKHLLRRLLRRHVPDSLVDRPKTGFGVPLGKWLFSEMREFSMDVLSRENLVRAGLDPAGVGKIVAAHIKGRDDYQYFLWPVICYVKWLLERPHPGLETGRGHELYTDMSVPESPRVQAAAGQGGQG